MEVQKRIAKILTFMLLIAGCLALGHGLRDLIMVIRSKSWPATPATIRDSSATNIEGLPEHKTHAVLQPQVVFEYKVADKTYFSNIISYFGANSAQINATYYLGNLEDFYRLQRRYPVGKTVTAYYNPENHREAALDINLFRGPILFFPLAGLLLCYCSCHIYVFGIFGSTNRLL